MPASLRTPVLQVDANVIHQVDTTNPDNLFSMWTVFARCAESVHQGRRLENLSWRLWTRETFCCEGSDQTTPTTATTLAKEIMQPRGSSTAEEVPQLSGSVDSVADEEAVEFTSESALEIVRPRIRRQDSCASSRSRGKERHITSDDLEKMVVSIVQAKEGSLSGPLPQIPHSLPLQTFEKTPSTPQLERSGSTTTESPCKSSNTPSVESLQQASLPELSSSQRPTLVIRGFSPSQMSLVSVSSQPAKPASPSAIPEPQDAPAPKTVQPKKKQSMFALGGSSAEDSYSEPGHSLDARKRPVPQQKVFRVGMSSGEESSLKSALHTSDPNSPANAPKTTSFSNKVVTRTFPTSAIDDDQSETDYIDESAIDDDDDSSDWEDSIEDSGKSSMEEKVTFQRDNSRANLPSRHSLITLMLAQNDQSQKVRNVASQSTSALSRARASQHAQSLVASPNDSDDSPLEMKRAPRAPPLRAINEIPRSTAQPIMTPNHGIQYQAPLSPRTTRRNMLATELTESLRRHLLWERSQKTSTYNAAFKRRHTSHDVANLKQYPEIPYMKKKDDNVNASSWDEYLNKEAFTGYHAQGW